MRALNRKMLRDLGNMKAQAIAIALVIGCGVATYVMSLSSLHALERSRAAYYERYRFADVFTSLKRAPHSLEARIAELPGVARVQTRIVRDVSLDIDGL
ncbi:MAG: ABC transporter permease, partial [Verrucomicrobiales bacterium]